MAEDFKRFPFYIPPARQGQRITARYASHSAEEIDRRIAGQGAPQVRSAKALADAQATPVIKGTFKIKQIFGDYMSCVTWNYESQGEDLINVAKPILLRTSLTAHGDFTFTYPTVVTRTASDGSTEENQVIVPALLVDDVITAERNITGGTGVTAASGKKVIWLADLGARAWAKATE